MSFPRTSLCKRLGIEVPIFGFSHSIEVTVATTSLLKVIAMNFGAVSTGPPELSAVGKEP